VVAHRREEILGGSSEVPPEAVPALSQLLGDPVAVFTVHRSIDIARPPCNNWGDQFHAADLFARVCLSEGTELAAWELPRSEESAAGARRHPWQRRRLDRPDTHPHKSSRNLPFPLDQGGIRITVRLLETSGSRAPTASEQLEQSL
jgi:hypothetical protein